MRKGDSDLRFIFSKDLSASPAKRCSSTSSFARPDREQIGNAQTDPERERLEHVQGRDALRLLLDLNNRVAAHSGIRQVFQAVSSDLRRPFKCECVGLALPEASDEMLRQHLIDFPAGRGHFKEGTTFPVEGSAAGLAYRRTKAVVLNSFSEVKANWNS